MALHKDLPIGEIHIPYQWTYADATARTGATGFISSDVGKLARQLDDNSVWMLTATTPTWKQIDGAGSGTDTNAIHKNVAAEISTITEKTTPVANDLLVLEDSEASNAKKRITAANVLKVCGRCNLAKVNFFDDFIGSLYNNRIWAVSGTGSFTDIDATGGVCRIRANSGASYTVDHGNNGAWQASKGVTITWRGYCVPGAAGLVEIGMMSSTDESNDWICWRYAPTESANFICESADANVKTTVNSGVAGDGNYHDFRIDITTGNVKFYLDGTLRATITTNITSDRLQPYVYNAGAAPNVADFYADWVEVTGAR